MGDELIPVSRASRDWEAVMGRMGCTADENELWNLLDESVDINLPPADQVSVDVPQRLMYLIESDH